MRCGQMTTGGPPGKLGGYQEEEEGKTDNLLARLIKKKFLWQRIDLDIAR